MTAAEAYAARVDAVIAQRTRLRGPQPPGDLFAGLPPEHPLLTADPRRSIEPNLQIIAGYVEPDDVIVDVGGGAGRFSLPLALRCREVINVDPSAAMLAAFEANARRAGIANARAVRAGWPAADPPRGSVALVNHVTYLTRDIVPFVEALAASASRRVIVTVGNPPPPARNREVFRLVYGEESERVPGHVELVNVLWELGIQPDVRVLPDPTMLPVPAPSREAAIAGALLAIRTHQWAFWPLDPELEARARRIFDARFDELFEQTADGYLPRWSSPGRDVLITWETCA
ncbi:MAG: methyltransferase domain-containing protein [Chloroflexota bacterium]|nr:methyltransferase domain-containing protein [Chloroflexota bacterium]